MHHLLTARARGIDASGIRRVFDLAAKMTDPIDLSIGQPDFEVPDAVRHAAVGAMEAGQNRYTPTQGTAPLREALTRATTTEFPSTGEGAALREDLGLLVTSGVSGGLTLAFLACLGPGDEVVFSDPAFVMYRHLATLAGAASVACDTYPDFRLTADRVEPLLTERTKIVVVNSPGNPTGVCNTAAELADLATLCARRGVLLITDEIYDAFTYADGDGQPAAPGGFVSPLSDPAVDPAGVLLLRGFSKTYGMTGWRLGHAVGPKPVVEAMTKLQQYTFVCAPSPAQAAGVAALRADVSAHVGAYARKRDRVVERLSPRFRLAAPGGAFYAFPEVPKHLGLTGTRFVEAAIERNVLVIPGSVFSARDTHFRLSYACGEATLERGLDVLCELAEG
ncbi:pyridoxal phosphate-dependent aminotransferase [Phycisphaera mikurensis]|uniref:Aminotransferase n=1 Tax=Phycisphaera mikurensis (strain NBRC 102666 / KCTC 22515 / FYK2301M01) TaxID=1142394 RepID=I0IEU3_PHYMF|nr:aminotransferase class I/II-fold pyridoxal phosphate-dependent enzyme [Phycisphaera mikurensis]MBB6441576.1 aspartate/methionine/tyrosine aminotransferase [Phycisphaera mikurensis]BAM03781.1 aminotransferase [Phycisphaera mikurensis NBRC 102666]